MTELKRLNVRLRPEMYDWIKQHAESRGLTMNAMMIFALETYYQQQMIMPQLPRMLEELAKDQNKE